MSAAAKLAIVDLVLALAGKRGYDAQILAESQRHYRAAWRDHVYVTGAHRDAESAWLIELHVFGRGRNRQCWWRLTDAGRALVEARSA